MNANERGKLSSICVHLRLFAAKEFVRQRCQEFARAMRLRAMNTNASSAADRGITEDGSGTVDAGAKLVRFMVSPFPPSVVSWK